MRTRTLATVGRMTLVFVALSCVAYVAQSSCPSGTPLVPPGIPESSWPHQDPWTNHIYSPSKDTCDPVVVQQAYDSAISSVLPDGFSHFEFPTTPPYETASDVDHRPGRMINMSLGNAGPGAPYGTSTSGNPLSLDPDWWGDDLCDGYTPSDDSGCSFGSMPPQFCWLLEQLESGYNAGYRRFILNVPAGDPFGLVKRMQSSQWWTMPAWKREGFQLYVKAWIDAKNTAAQSDADRVSVGVYAGSWLNWSQTHADWLEENETGPDSEVGPWLLTNQTCSDITSPDYKDHFSYNTPPGDAEMFPRITLSTSDAVSQSDMEFVYKNVKPWESAGIDTYWFDNVSPTLHDSNGEPYSVDDVAYLRMRNAKVVTEHVDIHDPQAEPIVVVEDAFTLRIGGEAFPSKGNACVEESTEIFEDYLGASPWLIMDRLFQRRGLYAALVSLGSGFDPDVHEIGIILRGGDLVPGSECPNHAFCCDELQHIAGEKACVGPDTVYQYSELGLVLWAGSFTAGQSVNRVKGLNIPLSGNLGVLRRFRSDFNGDGVFDHLDSRLFHKNYRKFAGTVSAPTDSWFYQGDINNDDVIDEDDLAAFREAAEWTGTNKPYPNYYEEGDINADGYVDCDDLVLLVLAMSQPCENYCWAPCDGDLNGDNVVDAADLAILCQILEENEHSCPSCE